MTQKQSPRFLLSNHAHVGHHLGHSKRRIDLPPVQLAKSVVVYLGHSFQRLDDPVQCLDVLQNQRTRYFRAHGIVVSKHKLKYEWDGHGEKLAGSSYESGSLGIHHSYRRGRRERKISRRTFAIQKLEGT